MCRAASMMSRPTWVVSGVPSTVTMPSLTVTVNLAGSQPKVPRMRSSVISLRICGSGLLYTLRTSERVTMPISVPSSLTTGSRFTRRLYIRRAASVTVWSGPMVTAGLVMRSAAVTPFTCDRTRWRVMPCTVRGTLPSSASLVSRSVSETTPMTLLSSSMTGKALSRILCSIAAISLYWALRLTAITWVLMTSLTVELMARPPVTLGRSGLVDGDDDDRAVGMVGDLGADRTHQQPLEPPGAAGADDDHVRAAGRVEELLGGDAGGGPDGDRRWPFLLAELPEHDVRLLLSRFAGPLGEVLVGGVRATPVAGERLVDGEHGERRVPDRRFVDGPLKGLA